MLKSHLFVIKMNSIWACCSYQWLRTFSGSDRTKVRCPCYTHLASIERQKIKKNKVKNLLEPSTRRSERLYTYILHLFSFKTLRIISLVLEQPDPMMTIMFMCIYSIILIIPIISEIDDSSYQMSHPGRLSYDDILHMYNSFFKSQQPSSEMIADRATSCKYS